MTRKTDRDAEGATPGPEGGAAGPDRGRRRLRVVAAVVALVAVVGVGLAFWLHGGGMGGDPAGDPQGASTPFAAPKGAVVDGFFNESDRPTAIPYGRADAPVTLTIIEDFRCPACKAFESILGRVYDAYVRADKMRVLFHPVRLIDINDKGTTGSMLAGSAAACAQDAGHFFAYHNALFANQPNERIDDYGKPARLLEVAKDVPGLSTPEFEQCVRSGRYEGFVQQNWDDFQKFTREIGTPTLLLNGKRLDFGRGNTVRTLIEKFEKFVEDAGGGPPPSSLQQSG